MKVEGPFWPSGNGTEGANTTDLRHSSRICSSQWENSINDKEWDMLFILTK